MTKENRREFRICVKSFNSSGEKRERERESKREREREREREKKLSSLGHKLTVNQTSGMLVTTIQISSSRIEYQLETIISLNPTMHGRLLSRNRVALVSE